MTQCRRAPRRTAASRRSPAGVRRPGPRRRSNRHHHDSPDLEVEERAHRRAGTTATRRSAGSRAVRCRRPRAHRPLRSRGRRGTRRHGHRCDRDERGHAHEENAAARSARRRGRRGERQRGEHVYASRFCRASAAATQQRRPAPSCPVAPFHNPQRSQQRAEREELVQQEVRLRLQGVADDVRGDQRRAAAAARERRGATRPREQAGDGRGEAAEQEKPELRDEA